MATELPDIIVWNDSSKTNKNPSTALNLGFSDYSGNNTTVSPTKQPNTLHLEYIGYVFVPLFLVCNLFIFSRYVLCKIT